MYPGCTMRGSSHYVAECMIIVANPVGNITLKSGSIQDALDDVNVFKVEVKQVWE